jgi:hypothetical protein
MAPRKRVRHAKAAKVARHETRNRALDAIRRMRNDQLSLARAARVAGTTAATVKKYAQSALRRTEIGRYVARPSDRLTRHLQFLTPKGKVAISVRGSRDASRVASYWAAVDRFLSTGDASRLEPFVGRQLRSGNRTYLFITDEALLEQLGDAGEPDFENLYADVA